MKKFLVALSAIVFTGVFTSCDKSADNISPKQNYLSYMKDPVRVSVSNADYKKSTPAVGGYITSLYIKPATDWVMLDREQFLPNCDAFNYWGNPDNNPKWFTASSSISIPYWPKTNTRFVVRTTTGNADSQIAYMGITDVVSPTADGFGVKVRTCRLGDFLSVKNSLKKYRGCEKIQITVTYTKSLIDIEKTIQTSPATGTSWLQYAYQDKTQEVSSQSVIGDGDVVMYEGFDAKITGTIYINLTINSKTKTLPITAAELGHGLAINVDSKKLDYNNSGQIDITNCDITIDKRDIYF